MKKCLSCFFILLDVSILGTLMNTTVSEKGIEGAPAVIECSYAAEYKTFPKSFCKEMNNDCETLGQTDSQNDWKLEGRLSLHDNKEKHVFVVTIKSLTLEDVGRYRCGVWIPELHVFTVVHLSVMKVMSTSVVTLKQESVTDIRNSTQPAAPQLLSGFVSFSFYVGTFFAAVLLLSSILCVFKGRLMKGSAGTTVTENMKDVYYETQHCNAAEHNTSESSEVPPGPDFCPACITLSSSLTNQRIAPDLTDIFQTNHEACGVEESSDSAKNNTEPKYCCIEFPDAQDVQLSRGCDKEYSAVYSLIMAPKTENNSG